jgi:hypothetical protein
VTDPNETVQPAGTSRLALQQIERHRRLAPVADLCVMKKKEPKLNTITVNIPPYGTMGIVGFEGEDTLSVLKSDWPKLWPAVQKTLKSQLRLYAEFAETPIRLGGQKWSAKACKADAECFMGDQADVYLHVEWEQPSNWDEDCDGTFPSWDFFVKGTAVMHCQPAY